MEAIGGHHPGNKKSGKRKAARKGRAAHRRDRDLKSDEATTSSETTNVNPEESSDIFHDATDEAMEVESLGCHHRCTVAAPSVGSPRSPEKDVTRTQSGENSGVSELQQAPTARKSYWLKHYSHSAGQSIGVQTVDEDEINRRNAQSFKGDDREHLFLSSDVYEDARETLTDHESHLERGKDRRKKRHNTKKEIDKNQQLAAKDARRVKNGNVDCHHQRGATERGAAGHPDPEETSCCRCLLAVLFWLGVVMFTLLLLALVFVVFLLFSRNHGLGIGPSLIYSDVDLVRSAVNPSLDLRHNGPPPT